MALLSRYLTWCIQEQGPPLNGPSVNFDHFLYSNHFSIGDIEYFYASSPVLNIVFLGNIFL